VSGHEGLNVVLRVNTHLYQEDTTLVTYPDLRIEHVHVYLLSPWLLWPWTPFAHYENTTGLEDASIARHRTQLNIIE
jgi:hypothetical protein